MANQRRLIAFNRITADGYFAASDGGLDWAVPDDELDASAVRNLPEGDAIVFGRKTYEQFEGFWRKVVDDSLTAPDPHVAGRTSPALRSMATWINEATKIVYSRTLKGVTWRNSRLIREFDPRAQPRRGLLPLQPGNEVGEPAVRGHLPRVRRRSRQDRAARKNPQRHRGS